MLKDKINKIIQLLNSNDFLNSEIEAKKLLSVHTNNFDLNNILGVISVHLNKLDEAVHYFKNCVRIDKNSFNAYFNLGIALSKLGDFNKSEEAYNNSIAINPYYFEAYFNLGNLLSEKKDYQKSINYFLEALKIKKDDFEILNNLGINYKEINENFTAIEYFKRSILLNPNYPPAYNNLGSVFQKIGNFENAYLNYNKALELNPNFVETLNNLGLLMEDKNRTEDAINYYKKAISLDNKYFKAFTNLGNVFATLGKEKESLDCQYKALELNNNYPETLNNLGKTLNFFGQKHEGIKYLEKAISLKPDFSEAYNNMGVALLDLENYEEALKFLKKSILLNPTSCEVYNSLGSAYMHLGLFSESRECYKKSLQVNPEYNEAYHSMSYLDLIEGDFLNGWKNYEYRWLSKKYKYKNRYNLEKDIWNGQFLNGTLLVWSEQGVGDQIYFGRFLKGMKNLAKKIIFEVDSRLVSIFKDFFLKQNINNIEVRILDSNNLCNNFDKHIPIGSLPKFFIKDKKDFEKFSNDNFVINNKEKEKISEKIKKYSGLKIGISWKTLNKDQSYRSISLDDFLPILKIKEFNFFNLQFGDVSKEIEEFREKYNINIHSLDEINNLNDLEKLFAYIDSLDLIITVQNSTAHFAGSIGKKTILLLSKNHRWHWGINDKVSYFYPSIKIFRQEIFKNWNVVINDILKELKKNE